jgi:signal peptidase II
VRPLLFYATALVIVLCDQLSKWVVVSRLSLTGSRPVIGDFLHITYTENTGGAFSILQARNSVFVIIAIIAIGSLAFAYYRSTRRDLLVNAALALAMGGAVGNLIDRVRLQHVVDFFDLQFHGRNIWPIFNVADSAITVGIVLLAWHFVFKKEPAKDERHKAEELPTSQTPEHLNT